MIRIKIFYLTICAFGFGLATNMQVAYLSTLLQFAGYKTYLIPYIWLIAPLTGLIAQPLLGLISDNFYSSLGRRKPLFYLSTLLGTISLIIFPLVHNIYLMIFTIIIFDLSINGNALLSRALILDTLDNKHHTKAFSWSTAFSGLGAMSAGFLPWILFKFFYFSSTNSSPMILPAYIQSTFLIGAAIYAITSFLTLYKVREKIASPVEKTKHLASIKHSLKPILKKLQPNIFSIAKILFFAWIAVFTVWNYLNINIAQNCFKMPIAFTDKLNLSGSYLADASLLTAMYFGIIQISSTLFSLFIPFLNRYLSIYSIFTLGLSIGGLSLVSMNFFSSPLIIGFIVFFYGLSWAVIATCPYILIGKINSVNHHAFLLGILNIMIVLPQIITSLTIGFLYKYLFAQNARYVIFFAGISLLVSAGVCLKTHLKYPFIKNKKISYKPFQI